MFIAEADGLTHQGLQCLVKTRARSHHYTVLDHVREADGCDKFRFVQVRYIIQVYQLLHEKYDGA